MSTENIENLNAEESNVSKDNTQSINSNNSSVSSEEAKRASNGEVTGQVEDRNQIPIFNRSQLEKYSKQAKQKGYEEAKKEFEAALVNNQSNQSNENTQISQEQIEAVVEQRLVAKQQIAEANKIVNELTGKIEKAKEKFSDFDEKVTALNLAEGNKACIAMWANQFDNSAEVLYELADNPAKYARILTFVNNNTPELALSELKKISSSISENEKAKQSVKQPDVLQKIQTSNSAINNGNINDMSVSDLSKTDWLRKYR